MSRMLSKAIAAAAVAVPLAAAGPAAFAQGAGPTLQVATDQSPVGLDPHLATAFSTALINGNIYEGLTAIDADLRTVPALAEAWEVSSDGLTYTFRLKQGATFHDGSPVTAEDVVASFERVRNPATGSPFATRLAPVASMQAADPRTVRITLSAPSAPFATQLSTIAVVPARSARGEGDLQRQPVGTGPFRFAQWVPDTYIHLERHPGYHEQGLPKLGAVRFNIVPEAATRQVGLAGGTYQMLPSIDSATALSLQGQPNVRLLETQDLAYSLIGMNTTRAPFDRPEVREAVNAALDREELVQAAYFGRARPAGPLSPALTDWALPTAEFPCYAAGPDRARELLRAAGLTTPVPVTLSVLGSLSQVVDVAQVVQAQLNRAGFEVTLDVQEQGRFIQSWRNSEFQAFVSLNSGGPDPDDYFGRTFQTGGATNVMKFSDPAIDALLAEARSATDTARRKALYDDVQKRLACTGPIAHLAYGTLATATTPAVSGYSMIANRSTRALRETTLSR